MNTEYAGNPSFKQIYENGSIDKDIIPVTTWNFRIFPEACAITIKGFDNVVTKPTNKIILVKTTVFSGTLSFPNQRDSRYGASTCMGIAISIKRKNEKRAELFAKERIAAYSFMA